MKCTRFLDWRHCSEYVQPFERARDSSVCMPFMLVIAEISQSKRLDLVH